MKKMAIVCVDDEKIVLNSLKEQLRNNIDPAISLEVAECGEDALEIIDELLEDGYEIPLIISDYLMPEMSGDELFSIIHERLPDTMMILLTGQATPEGIVSMESRYGLFKCIHKPWRESTLILSIKSALSYYESNQI